MRTLRTLLAVVLMLFASTDVFALEVGFNADVHNGTGQDAYAFHLEGTLKSSTFPVQTDDFDFELPWEIPIPGFDWEYDGGTITHLSGDLYQYSGSWSTQSGSAPVPPSTSIHLGKYFDVTCNNVWIDVHGWWSNVENLRIGPEVPLIGFEVQDRILDGNARQLPQTVELFNDTTIPTEIMNLQMAITDEAIALEDLMEDSRVLESLTWVSLDSVHVLDPGRSLLFELGLFDIRIPPSSFLVTRGQAFDPTDEDYHFFALMAQSHVPEPATLGLLLLGGLALLQRKRST